MGDIAIVHGRNLEAVKVVAAVIELLGHKPVFFEDQKLTVSGLPFNFSVVDKLLDCDTTVVIFSPDEISKLDQCLLSVGENWQSIQRVRPNVMLELGIALGRKKNVTIVSFDFDHKSVPTDLDGLNSIHYVDSGDLSTKLYAVFQSQGIQLVSPDLAKCNSLPSYTSPMVKDSKLGPPYKIDPLNAPEEEIKLNEAERGLYESIGYEVIGVKMNEVDSYLRAGWQYYIMKKYNGVFVRPKYHVIDQRYEVYLVKMR